MTRLSAPISRNLPSISDIGFHVTPDGQNRKAGNAVSSMAMGPWSRSAEENRSATTYDVSISFSANSNELA